MKRTTALRRAIVAIAFMTIINGCGNTDSGERRIAAGDGGFNGGGAGGDSFSGSGSGGMQSVVATSGGKSATGGGSVALAHTGGTSTSSGSAAVGGEPAGAGGQAGSVTTGDSGLIGGATGTTTWTGTGGRGGFATGGADQSGGTSGIAGRSSSGGQVGWGTGGAATGGNRQTGGTTGTGGRIGTGGHGGFATGGSGSCSQPTNPKRLIAFGTTLDPEAQICESQQLAKSIANPSGAQWRAKGDQNRTYRFAAANATVPYRICIPPTWDGTSKLPLVMFLHSGFGNENTNLDENNKLLVNLAFQHGYALISPLGYQGAYGNFLALPAVFGQPAAAEQQIAAITASTERNNELSEKDVINVLELVLAEYPIDRKAMYLTGHSMGAGGTWYIGAKYAAYWTAFATLSGPFVQETGYPWENIRPMPNLITEGTSTAGLTGSRAVRDFMLKGGFNVQYKEVVADHGGMIPLVLPDVFAFFDNHRAP